MTAALPAPPSSGLPGDYFQAHSLGELRLQRCSACAEWNHPPQYRCRGCGSDDLEWLVTSGRGELFTWAVTYRGFHPAFTAELPLVTGVVELDEGPRVVALIRGVEPDALAAGMRVRAEPEQRAGQTAVLIFVPEGDAS